MLNCGEVNHSNTIGPSTPCPRRNTHPRNGGEALQHLSRVNWGFPSQVLELFEGLFEVGFEEVW